MTPLSKALTGLVIPNDSCVSHLNPSGETVDPELQKKNSKVAGNILCQILGEMVLDGKPATVKLIDNE